MKFSLSARHEEMVKVLEGSRQTCWKTMVAEIGENPSSYFRNKNWSFCDFTNSDMSDIDFTDAVLDHAIIRKGDLSDEMKCKLRSCVEIKEIEYEGEFQHTPYQEQSNSSKVRYIVRKFGFEDATSRILSQVVAAGEEKAGICFSSYLWDPKQEAVAPFEGGSSVKKFFTYLERNFAFEPSLKNNELWSLTSLSGISVKLIGPALIEFEVPRYRDHHAVCDDMHIGVRQAVDAASSANLALVSSSFIPGFDAEARSKWAMKYQASLSRFDQTFGQKGRKLTSYFFDYVSLSDLLRKLRIAYCVHPIYDAYYTDRSGLKKMRGADLNRNYGADYADVREILISNRGIFQQDNLCVLTQFDKSELILNNRFFETLLKSPIGVENGLRISTCEPLSENKLCGWGVFWTGLLANEKAINEAISILDLISPENLHELQEDVWQHGFAGQSAPDVKMLFSQLLEVSKMGLESRAIPGARGLVPNEAHQLQHFWDFLDPNSESRASGRMQSVESSEKSEESMKSFIGTRLLRKI